MKRIVIVLFVLLTLGLFASQASLTAAGGDCNAFGTGSIPDLTSLAISFTCAAEATVYFGACDSGSVPNDDLFEITYEGQAVSFNLYSSGSELLNIGSALVPAGSHTASLNSLSTTPFPPATYTYAISSDKAAVESTLFNPNICGADISSGPITSTCSFGPRNVPVFTQDAAPTNGTLEFRIMLGNEDSRQVSGLMMEWDIVAGQQLNNVMVPDLPAPRYARLWWQPADSADWYMLTSQYWHGDGTTDSEYGIECAMGAQPSYHTSFASAVPESAVCFDLLNGCN